MPVRSVVGGRMLRRQNGERNGRNCAMSKLSKVAGLSAIAFGLLPMQAVLATTAQEAVVDRARMTVQDLQRDPAFGSARDLMHHARAILIVPQLVKGGFFVGGEGGKGILLVHSGNGGWSAPAFYTIGSASFGLQIGLEESEMVLFIMSQKALDAVMQDKFKIGADAGIAVVTLGSNVEAATTAAVGADIVSWASSSGAYAGISLNGSIIAPSSDDNAAYYQTAAATPQIVYHMSDRDPTGAALHQALAAVQ
jgi:lipid-binding SYLF domain-containing protein